ncbi:spore germination protein [Petroclostridium sp. X23]|nr:spore germination protein [Petroclostridium sp. X23]WHH61732.1 spore germination protein [Petroclostridium sp. X23]
MFAFLLTLLVPATYIAITTFHQEIFPLLHCYGLLHNL